MIVTFNSLEEKGLHLLILKQVELLECAVLLHGEEGIERDTALDAIVALLLQGKVLSEVSSVSRVGLGSSGTVGHTELIDGVNISLLQVKRVVAGWHVSGWSDDVTENNVGVSELSAEETIHVGVVTRNLEITPEHLD